MGVLSGAEKACAFEALRKLGQHAASLAIEQKPG